ncbi:MAG: C_GCAxxG_C_C family protein [Anaerolineales bacterium]|nr:C_GCAxxG_C_C family protein [Anaerolineales bacterium]
MTNEEKNAAIESITPLMFKGYHCTEAMIVALGDLILGEVPELLVRTATGFSGGVGSTHQEMCGALVGGLMLINAKYGRSHYSEDDSKSYTLSKRFLQRFEQEFSAVSCEHVREQLPGMGYPSCKYFVPLVAALLLDMLENEV